MKISIIVPVYNVEKYLQECLDSILMQDFKDYEIICVNDCSTDSSGMILEFYKEKYANLKVITNEKNGGLSYSRNQGLKIAVGEYILFIDSDDYLVPGALRVLYQNSKELDSDILYFDKKIVYEKDYRGTEDWVPKEELEYNQIFSGIDFFVKCAEQYSFKSVNAYLQFFRRKFLEDNSLRFYDGVLHEDLLFYFQCAMVAKRVAKISEELYIYRKRNGAITERITNDRKQSLFIVFDEILSYWKTHNFSIRENCAIQTYIEMVYGNLMKYCENCADADELVLGGAADKYLYKAVMNKKIDAKIRYSFLTEKEFECIKKAKKVWVYGAGNVGTEIALLLEGVKEIAGYIVTNKDSADSKKFGWKIFEIDSAPTSKQDLFIIAVTKRRQKEIRATLLERGFENLIYACK